MAKKTKYRDEDLFKDSTMTFGEHLEELRAALFKSLLFTVLAFILVLALGWADKAVVFIQIPLTDALEKFYANHSLKQAKKRIEAFEADELPIPSIDQVQDAVERDRLAMHLWFLDPRMVVEALASAGFQVEITGTPALIQGDFLNLGEFCDEIITHRETEGTPAHFIWQRLEPAAREIVEQGAKNADGVSRDQRRQLAQDLDEHVLTDPEFYEETKSSFDDLTALRERSWYDPSLWKDKVTGEYTRQTKRAERLERILKKLPKVTDEETEEETDPSAEDRAKRAQQLKILNRQLLALLYPEAVPAGPRRANMVALPIFANISDDPRLNPKSLNVQEMFMVWIKAAIVLSLVIASPFVFFFIWSFVAAGLYPHEKGYVYLYLPFSLGLFLGGCALCFFYVLQYVLDFLFLFNDWMNVDPDMRISEWFGFALLLPLGFGIAFQLPLVMLFLERIGVMTVSGYLSKWRISVMVIFVASAILTPADPYSMLLMSIPLVFLYFLGIGLCRYLPSRRSPFAEEETA